MEIENYESYETEELMVNDETAEGGEDNSNIIGKVLFGVVGVTVGVVTAKAAPVVAGKLRDIKDDIADGIAERREAAKSKKAEKEEKRKQRRLEREESKKKNSK